jgi:hypothetical protein
MTKIERKMQKQKELTIFFSYAKAGRKTFGLATGFVWVLLFSM